MFEDLDWNCDRGEIDGINHAADNGISNNNKSDNTIANNKNLNNNSIKTCNNFNHSNNAN